MNSATHSHANTDVPYSSVDPSFPLNAVPEFASVPTQPPVRQVWWANRGLLAIMDQGVVSATSFVTVLILGRLLSQETLGIYHLTIGFFFFLQCISDQLINLPFLIRQSRLEPSRISRLNGSVLVHNFVLSSFGGLAIFVAGVALGLITENNREMATAFIALSFAVPWMLTRDFIHNFLHTRLSQFNVLIFDTLVVTLQLGSVALLAWLKILLVPYVFLAMGLACAVVAWSWLFKNRNLFQIRKRLLVPQWRLNWNIGRWALGSYLIGSAAPFVLPWILAYSHGLKGAGILAACMTLAGLPQMFLRGTSKYLAPLSANAYGKRGLADLNNVMKKFFLLYAVSMSATTLLFGFFGESILQFCFNGTFAGTGATMLVLGLACLFQGPDMVAGSGLNSISRTDLNFVADVARCIAILISAPLAIPAYGVLGVALVLMISMIASGIARLFLFYRTARSLS